MALASQPASRMVHSGDPAGEPLYTKGLYSLGDLGLYKGLINPGGIREGPEGLQRDDHSGGSAGSIYIGGGYIPYWIKGNTALVQGLYKALLEPLGPTG